MKGIMAKAVAGMVLGGLAAGSAFAGLSDPQTVAPPEPASTSNAEDLDIIVLKVHVEQVKLDAVKAQGSAKSQKEKDQIAVIIQMLDDIYAKLEGMLDSN